MHSKKPHQEPFTLAALSSPSIHHLRAASAKIDEDDTFQFENEVEVVFDKEKSNDNAKFTLFLDLPLEIQAKVWKLFIEAEPRIIQPGSFMNEPNILRQLSRQIKEDCLTLHGFVDLDQLKRREEQNNNTIFHLQTDLLHLGPNSPWIWGPRSSTRRFGACGALDKIRCVAIMNLRSSLTASIYFESFREYRNLEVVFVVIGVLVRDTKDGWREKEWVKFREVDDEKAVTLVHWARWLPERLCKSSIQEKRDWIQGMMARGSQRVAPRVVFVEEIRAWDDSVIPRPDGLG